MKSFRCACGQRVYFRNDLCLACGRTLGIDPDAVDLVALDPVEGSDLLRGSGPDSLAAAAYRRCRNGIEHGHCNWLVPADSDESFCLACRLNDVIPNLSSWANLGRWVALERAKRRMVFELLEEGLPVSREQIRFVFLEDRRTNPDVDIETVTTGHLEGVITINVAEANPVHRENTRVQLGERYRTLLGHFRHESGHCYWVGLVPEGPVRDEFRRLFGDERQDYRRALAAYYANPPSSPVPQAEFISAYASSHPFEDWAESWAHLFHMRSALRTAYQFGWIDSPEADPERWAAFLPGLNELMRSLGHEDAYPFVVSPRAWEKIDFVSRRISDAARAAAAARASRTPPGC